MLYILSHLHSKILADDFFNFFPFVFPKAGRNEVDYKFFFPFLTKD